MEKGLARFRVSLLCFCCGWFVAAGLLRLFCCAVLLRCFVALRWQTAAGGPSHFVGPFPFREPMPPAAVCHLSAAGTPTASWSTSLFGSQCSCGCLPPQRRRYSNRVLAQCPFLEPMPPAAVCHLSASGTPTASWHGDHAHKYARGILAWRRGHLSTLWHGDPQQNDFWGRVTWQACLRPVLNRSRADA